MPIEIDEVIRRSEQGSTQPYICRGSNDKTYYVKGKGAGFGSLWKEWIAGSLALQLGLPIAAFSLVHVPKALYDVGRTNVLADLGFGVLFGSEHVESSSELSVMNAGFIQDKTKRDIAAFDWWVKNGDRTLTENGGNPNILWSESCQRPFVIDHNLAFDSAVTLISLLESHIFAPQLQEICEQPSLQRHYQGRFEHALESLDGIFRDIPQRWHHADEAETVKVNFSIDAAIAILERHRSKDFWKRT